MSQILKGIKFPGMEDVFIAPDHNNMIHTTMIKVGAHTVEDSDTGEKTKVPRKIYLQCHNLVPGRQYTIKLYTKQRRRGKSSLNWYFNPQDKQYTRLGYESLALTNGTSVPDWMPNGGILQNTWTFIASETTYKMLLPLETWILDLLKPKEDKWMLMGTQEGHNVARQFQFRIYDPVEDYEGEAKNTLLINEVDYYPPNSAASIGFTAIK